MDTPVLFLQAESSAGQISQYVSGLRKAGVAAVEPDVVPDTGHLIQDEAPEQLWQRIADFARLPRPE